MHRSRSRQPKPERRIQPSGKGRISFRPGKEHPLDVQIEEANRAKEQLDEQLAHFAEALRGLAPLEEIASRFATEDQALRHFLAEHYSDYFHQDHIEATFLLLRRRRAIARLQAAQAALDLVRELLTPDTFVDDLLETLRERTPEDVEADRGQLTGNAQAVREQLARFDARLQAIRGAITRGNGWIERYFIHKSGWRPKVVKLATPFGVPVVDTVGESLPCIDDSQGRKA